MSDPASDDTASDYEDDENGCDLDYYAYQDDGDVDEHDGSSKGDEEDPEAFSFSCLTKAKATAVLEQTVEKVAGELKVTTDAARLLLKKFKWDEESLKRRFTADRRQILLEAGLIPRNNVKLDGLFPDTCDVCDQSRKQDDMFSPACGHSYCKICWSDYIKAQLDDGRSTTIECMRCSVMISSSASIELLLLTPELRQKYHSFALRDCVEAHPRLRWCPGVDCDFIIQAPVSSARKVQCHSCSTSFCFCCGDEYHAPADCITIQQWLHKCKDDSETANYIRANTKDCPRCQVCIEKNGGCNHMVCGKCHHEFCWMCVADWQSHNREYYECSRYKAENESSGASAKSKAREALNRYLFYFERWDNHRRSLKLENDMREKINAQIDEKVKQGEGTWIDWQYLKDASTLLLKSRYTLQYTYPFVYFMNGTGKELFEYQQAQLEREIEDLSWKIERAESTSRGDIENQMAITEKRRLTLLKDHISN
ncbi:E3 ubiquitin-protein ligase ARIH2-like [Corticium candelabrum]|uniref:E3 ubiquitin-protein ligase ARIH2-like n=1 Tax=Corticium candelabrum TaxID=121492 RepID=UPI002E262CB9|nr:E3 ubiquitin-protein ligase ARIH2-like [Corticium candelabrum]